MSTTYADTMTEVQVDLGVLNKRITEFAQDPLADVLAQLEPGDLDLIAVRDPDLASRLLAAQQRAEALALDAFALNDYDSVEMALYLIDLCPAEALIGLAEIAGSSRQLWALGECLLGRFPDVLDDPDRALGAEAGSRFDTLLQVISFIALDAPRPRDPDEIEPARTTAPGTPPNVNLYDTVIVHGTYAKSETWWRQQPGDRNFWAYIHDLCPDLYGEGKEFRWSGKNANPEREQGARDFIDWWNSVGAPKSLQVIAHSHGCNVVYLACVMEPRLRIANMVALGGPVRTWYPPPIGSGRIERLHNVYSRFDPIQIGGSWGGQRGEGRTLADSVNITNYHVPWQNPKTKVLVVQHHHLHEEIVWHDNGLANKTIL